MKNREKMQKFTQLYTEPVIRQLFMNNTHKEEDILRDRWKKYRQDIFSDEHVLGLMQENMEYMQGTGRSGGIL